MYARTTLNDIYEKYRKYHKEIHDQLLSMKRKEINKIAKKDQLYQDNMCFQVRGYEELLQHSPKNSRSIMHTFSIKTVVFWLLVICFIL